ncbi:MAG: hypothetical protein ACEQSR_03740 [Candidatus Methylacidiphilales bacterium]
MPRLTYREITFIEDNFTEEEVHAGVEYCSYFKLQKFYNLSFKGTTEVKTFNEDEKLKAFKIVKKYFTDMDKQMENVLY